MMIRNVSWASYYYDFWRSCDTEDWSNDAGNTAAHHRNKLQLNTYSHRKYFKILLYLSNKCSPGENKNTRTCVNIKLVKTRPVGFNFCFQNSYVIMMLICSTLPGWLESEVCVICIRFCEETRADYLLGPSAWAPLPCGTRPDPGLWACWRGLVQFYWRWRAVGTPSQWWL